MQISKLIEQLEKVKAESGELDVKIWKCAYSDWYGHDVVELKLQMEEGVLMLTDDEGVMP